MYETLNTVFGDTMNRFTLLLMAGAIACGLALAPESTTTTTQLPQTPDEAIAELVAGNKRYVKNKAESANPASARPALAAGQAPFAAFIRCADSRVSPEICFDQPLGGLFVTGIAGNIVTPEVIASLEYTVAVLGSKLIVIMGHSSCGAVEAAIQFRNTTNELPGSLPMLIDQIIVPCTLDSNPEDPNKYLADAVTCNANKGIEQLINRSPVLAEAVKSGKLKIIAGVQDLGSGKFTITKQ